MYVPRSLLCRPQGVCEAGRGLCVGEGVSAAGPGVNPGGAGADGSSSKGESSSPIHGGFGGPGGSLSSPGEKRPREQWGCSAPPLLWRSGAGPGEGHLVPLDLLQPKGLLVRLYPGMVGAEVRADKGMPRVVCPPFPALVILLTACTGGPMTPCHQPGTTKGIGRRTGNHPGCVPGQQHCKVSSMGTGARVTQPHLGRVCKPKPPRNMQ